MKEDEPIKISNNDAAKAWIEKVYQKYPTIFKNNHVMMWGEGDTQQLAMFELTPSFSKRGAVEVKWFQAYPLRQGVGSRAMKELQAMAQADGIALTLFPWQHGQVSQSKLTKFYKGQGFAPIHKGSKSMKWDPAVGEAMDQGSRWTGDEPYRQLVELDDLEEDWKNWVAGGAMALGALGAANQYNSPVEPVRTAKISKITQPDAAPEVQVKAATPVVKAASPTVDTQAENVLYQTAKKEGMKGSELAQFLAQTKHETWNFSRLQEKPQPKVKDYFAKKYDVKHSPRTAKILGNKQVGDGARYHGRGYIQLTGRDNYRMAGDALKINLLKQPELAARPDIALKVALWYWNTRVKPGINNFDDTAAVTKKINSSLSGLEDRHANFIDYKKRIKST
jgi:predicted chitinase